MRRKWIKQTDGKDEAERAHSDWALVDIRCAVESLPIACVRYQHQIAVNLPQQQMSAGSDMRWTVLPSQRMHSVHGRHCNNGKHVKYTEQGKNSANRSIVGWHAHGVAREVLDGVALDLHTAEDARAIVVGNIAVACVCNMSQLSVQVNEHTAHGRRL